MSEVLSCPQSGNPRIIAPPARRVGDCPTIRWRQHTCVLSALPALISVRAREFACRFMDCVPDSLLREGKGPVADAFWITSRHRVHAADARQESHPGGNPGANIKSISHRCYLCKVSSVWELNKETIHLPLSRVDLCN